MVNVERVKREEQVEYIYTSYGRRGNKMAR